MLELGLLVEGFYLLFRARAPPETYFIQYFCASRLATVLFPQAVIPAKQITLFFLRACLAVMD